MSLKRARLLRGVRGRAGGYLLTRAPAAITAREIVEASIGPINVVECVREPETCPKTEKCCTRWVYERINDGITTVLDSVTLQDLLDRSCDRSAPPPTCHDVRAPRSGSADD